MRLALFAAVSLLPVVSGCTVLDDLRQGLTGEPRYQDVQRLSISEGFALTDAPAKEENADFQVAEGSIHLTFRAQVTFDDPAGIPEGAPQGLANLTIHLPDGTIRGMTWERSGEQIYIDSEPQAGRHEIHFQATGQGSYDLSAAVRQPVAR